MWSFQCWNAACESCRNNLKYEQKIMPEKTIFDWNISRFANPVGRTKWCYESPAKSVGISLEIRFAGPNNARGHDIEEKGDVQIPFEALLIYFPRPKLTWVLTARTERASVPARSFQCRGTVLPPAEHLSVQAQTELARVFSVYLRKEMNYVTSRDWMRDFRTCFCVETFTKSEMFELCWMSETKIWIWVNVTTQIQNHVNNAKTNNWRGIRRIFWGNPARRTTQNTCTQCKNIRKKKVSSFWLKLICIKLKNVKSRWFNLSGILYDLFKGRI